MNDKKRMLAFLEQLTILQLHYDITLDWDPADETVIARDNETGTEYDINEDLEGVEL